MDFRVFSSKIVHAELQRGGYQPPSLRTVARWTSTGKAPAWAEQAIRNLLGIETKAAPDWERLMRTVDAIAERVGVSLDEEQAVAAAVAERELPPGSGSEPDQPADDLAWLERHGGSR